MALPVFFIESAENDLKELKQYLTKEFGLPIWQSSYKSIKEAINNIAEFPLSGVIPQELALLAQAQYRQVISGMNRIIYEVKSSKQGKEQIYIHVVADVRKDLNLLLNRRLVQA